MTIETCVTFFSYINKGEVQMKFVVIKYEDTDTLFTFYNQKLLWVVQSLPRTEFITCGVFVWNVVNVIFDKAGFLCCNNRLATNLWNCIESANGDIRSSLEWSGYRSMYIFISTILTAFSICLKLLLFCGGVAGLMISKKKDFLL